MNDHPRQNPAYRLTPTKLIEVNMRAGLLSLYLIFILIISSDLQAQTLYKSVDASGNVVYSDEPPVGAVSVSNIKIEGGPSKASVKAAQRQADDLAKKLEKRQAERDVLANKKAADEQVVKEEAAAEEVARNKAIDEASILNNMPPADPGSVTKQKPLRPGVTPDSKLPVLVKPDSSGYEIDKALFGE